MKLTTKLLTGLVVGLNALTILSAAVSGPTAALARPSLPALTEECGALGVMEVPAGVNPADVRHCADHPSGRDRGDVSLIEEYSTNDQPKDDNTNDNHDIAVRDDTDNDTVNDSSPEHLFGPQACNRGPPYGCYHGSCWKECFTPRKYWCWLAESGGSGPWRRCKWDYDCRPEATKGTDCGIGCPSCGCSC
ncbi:hypothetical protein FB567DRAFT_578692 [Paraphoma chrysanthemicola]|uniref:Uncharacterized protein n=1 Tax=Paraphoma chrysanthemicola TaxID=798071 RepID=A0A8K0VZM8_9PLEO|nr:hypothetical protein FB567DRAFT_578692 [Paraphoma chrysanthemicola]